MRALIEQDILLAEDVRLVKRLYRVPRSPSFPDGLKFAFQYLVLKEGIWREVCRVDNYEHAGGTGTHVHKHGSVTFRQMTFEEAEDYIIALGERLR